MECRRAGQRRRAREPHEIAVRAGGVQRLRADGQGPEVECVSKIRPDVIHVDRAPAGRNDDVVSISERAAIARAIVAKLQGAAVQIDGAGADGLAGCGGCVAQCLGGAHVVGAAVVGAGVGEDERLAAGRVRRVAVDRERARAGEHAADGDVQVARRRGVAAQVHEGRRDHVQRARVSAGVIGAGGERAAVDGHAVVQRRRAARGELAARVQFDIGRRQRRTREIDLERAAVDDRGADAQRTIDRGFENAGGHKRSARIGIRPAEREPARPRFVDAPWAAVLADDARDGEGVCGHADVAARAQFQPERFRARADSGDGVGDIAHGRNERHARAAPTVQGEQHVRRCAVVDQSHRRGAVESDVLNFLKPRQRRAADIHGPRRSNDRIVARERDAIEAPGCGSAPGRARAGKRVWCCIRGERCEGEK